MARPPITIEIDFANGPLTANAANTWTDITAYVHTIKIRRGRQDALNRIEAGTASLLLDNSDRRFDPTYTSGPYYPAIVPMRKIRIWSLYDSVLYLLYTGYITSWPPDWPGGLDATVPISCVDAYTYFASKKLNGPYADESTDQSINTWLTNINWPVADRALSPGQSTVTGSVFTNISALQHFQNVADTESGLFFIDELGRPTFQNRHWRLENGVTSVATYGDLAPDLPWYKTTKTFDDKNIWNEVRITRTGSSDQVATDAGSQAAYFTRTYAKTLPLASDADALALAQWLVGRYAQPAFRYTSVTLDGLMDDLLWPEMLGRTISQQVTIVERPPGGAALAISKACYIEGISHDIADNKWLTTFQLSPADTLTYWVLGNSTLSVLNTSTRLAY